MDALKWIMHKGYDKTYGARPIARTVEEFIKKPLVDELLFGRLVNGGQVIVSLENSSLRFVYNTNKIEVKDGCVYFRTMNNKDEMIICGGCSIKKNNSLK
jgi:hypothetical protein